MGTEADQPTRCDVITITRLNKKQVVVNAELVKFVESTPDTMITLVSGDKIMVLESIEEVVDRAIAYGRRIRCFSADGLDLPRGGSG